MTFGQTFFAFTIIYICIYALINRICQCTEHCATARAFSRLYDSATPTKTGGDKGGTCGDPAGNEK